VLSEITLSCDVGVQGLLGPNGAGKTTLLHLVATLDHPTSGTLRLLGLNPRDRRERQQIRRNLGFLPQSMGVIPDFTAAEFVEYFALMRGVLACDAKQRVATALDRVGMGRLAGEKLKTLSGGQQRRVGIAQAIVNEPLLLLLDEPTVGLDPDQRVAFRALVRELGQRSTVIVSTHLVEDVAAACSRVALLDEGRVVFDGTPDDLQAMDDRAAAGDTALERGYSRVLGNAGWRANRVERGA
jgi:ABC-type multidrug transport system ATPase subunit